ncbi:hypothetical protein I4U23_017274 [Adineta vaga]|nr:hypothetical protein I4U23_017274 [Adineta vaga]
MLPDRHRKCSEYLCVFIAFFAITNAQSNSTSSVPSSPCPNSQLLCGGITCYNPSTQHCSDGTICQSPSRVCSAQCLRDNQICVKNITVCNIPKNGVYYSYQRYSVQSCNGTCYDSATEICTNGIIECPNNCSGKCYNSSVYECVSGSLCPVGYKLCTVKYTLEGSEYNTPTLMCYNSSYTACLNNSICYNPSRVCNGECLQNKKMCVNNLTTCNIANNGLYYDYQAAAVYSCNGTCYDLASETCTNGIIECPNNCSGKCYNSSIQECFNGTICNLNESVCYMKYTDWGDEYEPPLPLCYNPSYQACVNNSLSLCSSRVCNGQCLEEKQLKQIQLCNGICYDTIIENCENGYIILLQMKAEETRMTNEYQQAKINLAEFSYFEDKDKWNNLFDVVHQISFKLAEFSNELRSLEYIHAHDNRGVLPY